jgi:predicted ATPase/class 3 adenylate cyclase
VTGAGSGVYTFLITDLVASTRGWQADAAEMSALLEQHDEILVAAISAMDGRVFKHTGDGMCAVFVDPASAVAAAVSAQRSLVGRDIFVRMGIHVGVAISRGDDFFGLTVNRCARITEAAHGSQILVSLAAEEVVRDALPAAVSLLSLGPVRLRDLGHDDQLFQVVASGLPHQFPPPRSLAGTPASFPPGRGRLIGRAAELGELELQLRPGRVVTVVGAGGCGKTRMALEVLSRRYEQFGGGVFADFSTIGDPALVAAIVVEAVDMAPGGELNPTVALSRFLADRSMLLVLDNCEHVLDAACDLVESLLSTCPHLRLLATSREPLGIDGEFVWRLPSLTGSDAAALFIERAIEGGAPPLSDRDLPMIAEICAHLDGIPLAVELAAKQAVHLSLPRVRDMLEDRFRLLVGGSRRALPRQRTLEATMAWSYDLLDDNEQHLLRHLAVFTGPFTMEAAAFVAGSAEDALATIAHRLGALHHKSLVVFDGHSGRYRLLETVRAFGRLRLTDTNQSEEANQRLYDWLLQQAPGPWRYPFSPELADDIDVELDNLRTALEWCAASGRRDAAAVLAAAYGPMWFVTIRGDEGLAWLVLPAELDEQLPLDDRLAWRTAATWAAIAVWDVEQMRQLEDHLRLVPPGHPALCPLLFVKAWIRTDRAEHRRLVADVRNVAGDDPVWTANCDLIEGLTRLLDGQIAEAIAMLTHSVEMSKHTGVAAYGMNLAVALHVAGCHDDVTTIVAELQLHRRSPSAYWGDLVTGLILVIEAVGRRDLASARGALADLMTTTARRYPHVASAYGFGVQAATTVAYLAERPEDALMLLAGSRRHRLDVRYEGAAALGNLYDARCRDMVTEAAATDATRRGERMSIDAVVALANRIADHAQ